VPVRERGTAMLELGYPEWIAYDVHGTTLMEVDEVISAMPEAGRCDWSESSYSLAWGDDGKVSEVEAVIRYRVTMPTWVEVDEAPQAAQDEWWRFWSALEGHEQGHVDLVNEHIAGVDEKMLGTSEAGAKKAWDDAFDAINRASKAYDDSTKNGQNTGTILDLDAGVPVEESEREDESEDDPS